MGFFLGGKPRNPRFYWGFLKNFFSGRFREKVKMRFSGNWDRWKRGGNGSRNGANGGIFPVEWASEGGK